MGIFKLTIIEIGINARNRVDSAQDRDYWRTLVLSLTG